MFSNTYIIGQNTKDYFLKIKQGHDLGIIQKTLNNDSTLTLSINNSSFANLINQKPLYKFEKPFLNLNSPFLDLVYLMTINDNVSINDILNRAEVVGMIAAKTNNGLGIASLAHNASIVSAPRLGDQAVYTLSQIPGVKIINCSWQSICTYNIALVCDGQIQDSKNLLKQ